ncbi:hypothetical protein [Acinetobacter piscicola]|uniref:hypothetical protein n=1 Tax=Acinetobacter piscicola TaxID=2006115 RepID=UPI001BC89033|nr:hypothetical protein [Acinetobacter piscicola]
MAQFHHGISKKESSSGIIPMRDAATNTIALIAFSNDADENVFPLDTPVLVTSINRALAASGTEGNLRASLETIAAITNPTLIVVRISDPFTGETFDQSKVIGTTLPSGQRTGLQAFLTAKSILGLTPKIIAAPDVESPAVVQAIATICQKLRAYSYITPRDEFGVMLPTMEEVVTYRDTLGFREIEIVYPEGTNENVFLGKLQTPYEISCNGATNDVTISYDSNAFYKITINNQLLLDTQKLLLNASGNVLVDPYTANLVNFVHIHGLMFGVDETLKAINIQNVTADNLRISVEAYSLIGLDGNNPTPIKQSKYIFKPMNPVTNNTLIYENGDVESGYSKVSFCLSPLM